MAMHEAVLGGVLGGALRTIVLATLVAPCVGGCGSSVSNPSPTPASDEVESKVETQSLLGGNSLGLSLSGCQPLTCCFPSGGEWGSNAFEDTLKGLGCTTPRAYTQSAGASEWWLYSECPLSLELVGVVLKNATVAPYHSQIVVNECLELGAVLSLKLNSVFVEFDPTCGSCAPARR